MKSDFAIPFLFVVLLLGIFITTEYFLFLKPNKDEAGILTARMDDCHKRELHSLVLSGTLVVFCVDNDGRVFAFRDEQARAK